MSKKISLEELTSLEFVRESVGHSEISPGAAEECARLAVKCARELVDAGVDGRLIPITFWVPGRIEVLGKHTDYAGGRSLLAAVDRGICFVAVPRRDSWTRTWDPIRGDSAEFEINPELQPSPHWLNYAKTSARRLARNFGPGLLGADIAFGGNLPSAAGMSSSSALIVGFSLIFIHVNRLVERDLYRSQIPDREALAGYLGTVENGQSYGMLAGDQGVGTFGGSEDHTAILCCRPDELSQYRFCPVQLERRLPFPKDLVFVIGVSGVVSDKTGAAREKYNRASRLASEVASAWNRKTRLHTPNMAAAVRSCGGRTEEIEAAILEDAPEPKELLDRFRQFYQESEQIIPRAGDALLAGNLPEFGRLVAKSQELAETLLKNQVDETVFLVASALELGAIGSSAFGAGFGGSVWALSELSRAPQLLSSWSDAYSSRFPEASERAEFFLAGVGPAACELG